MERCHGIGQKAHLGSESNKYGDMGNAANFRDDLAAVTAFEDRMALS